MPSKNPSHRHQAKLSSNQSDAVLDAFEFALDQVKTKAPEKKVIEAVRLSEAFQRLDPKAQERLILSIQFTCRLQSGFGHK